MARNKVSRCIAVIISLLFVSVIHAQSTEDLQRQFTELRFGMFIHFGIMTFTGQPWATANQDVTKFNPVNLDCAQWADAAVSAKMKFGILTAKHHDGFCLWDSKYTENDVAKSPWKNGKGDVIREYVDAFRAKGLEPCLYYSIWDNTAGVGNGTITAKQMDFINGQLTEILTNYGEIKLLFIDGWSWKMGHKAVPYDEIRSLVKKLQPNCLLVDNTHLQCLYHNDMLHYEAGGVCPPTNTQPALLSQLINKNGGNDWFWGTGVPTASLMSVTEIVTNNLKYLEPKWCTFVLNCPPNKGGILDANIINRLKEVGNSWTPDLNRAPLPVQPPFIENNIIPVSASAASGTANNAIDGINDRYYYSVWESAAALPQSITIDLGKVYDDITTLYYVPKYKTVTTPTNQGSIKEFKIFVSNDKINFNEVANGEWNGDSSMKVAAFSPVTARYIKLEAITSINNYAAATEIAVGRLNIQTDINESQGSIIPNSIILEQNYPNPFNPDTVISYNLPKAGFVSLKVYDILGNEIQTLVNDLKGSGIHYSTLNTQNSSLSSGIYFYRLTVDNNTLTKKMLLLQ